MSDFIKSPFGKIISAVFAVVIAFIGIGLLIDVIRRNQKVSQNGFETFATCSELNEYINKDKVVPPIYDGGGTFGTGGVDFVGEGPTAQPGRNEDNVSGDGGEPSPDYSETNTQVEGVDESDIIKTDGSYIYHIKGTTVMVFDATQPADTKKLSEINVPGNPIEMFLHNDSLIVLSGTGTNYYGGYYDYDKGAWPIETMQNGIFVYDVTNPEKPSLKRELKVEGYFKTARLTDDTVYLITHKNIPYGLVDDVERTIPRYSNSTTGQTDYVQAASCNEISHFGNDTYSYVSVVAFDTQKEEASVKVLVGNAANVYVSRNNLYLATTEYTYPETDISEPTTFTGTATVGSDDFITRNYEPPIVTTEVFKLSMIGTNIAFAAQGSVPGTILNQFSMDEYDGNFRIATNTNVTGGWNDGMSNNVYVLDSNLKIIGTLEGIAPNEKIYSTRFMGEKLYMVTFRTVDPFFVVDLSKPSSPQILGQLKLPGYSDYLHPYDENHVIGFGKDTEAISPDAARAKGLKVALFDVTDVSNPTLKSEMIFGENYGDSDLLRDHKALLFDREKQLLVIPARFDLPGNINAEQQEVMPAPDYRSNEFNGFLVLTINLTEGIKERGRIQDSQEYYSYSYNQKRSLFIDSFIFATMSDGLQIVKMDTVENVKKVLYE